nr:PAS domain S-box protein [Deltaproteobacteria bacterium]
LQGIAKQVIARLELRRRMVTARRHSEHAIQRSEALTSALVDSALDCVIAIDQEGRIIEFNPAAERTFGRARADVVGQVMSDLIVPPALRAHHEHGLANHLASGLQTNLGRRLELTGMRADGSEFPLELSITRVATEPPIFAGFIRDTTDRKRAERELREGAERFELLTRATHDAVWDWDLRSDAIWWSQAVEQFGLDRGRITAIDGWVDLLHPDERESIKRSLDEAIAGGAEHWYAEYQLRRGDGTYATVLDRGYILHDEERQPVRMIGVIMDTTERRRLEAQLLQSQKMEAVGQLAGGIAHDFNNVLTVIQCNAYLLDRQAPDRDTNAQEILQATERAASLTRQLLLFSRTQRLRTQVLDFDEVVRNMIRMLKRVLGEHVTVIARSAPSLPAVEADASMLEQVLLNLAVNARDAMPEGGTLTIETGTVTTERPITDFGLDGAPGTYVTLTVRDTGAGIPATVLPQIFDPFFTTKELGKGTGLGLATVYGIVRQHKGWIDVQSVIGIGTAFIVALPAAVAPAVATPVTRAPATPPTGTETILVVEDDEIVRHHVIALLRRWGYTVLQAVSGVDALELWQRAGDRIDLVLTDLMMPHGVTGRELGNRLRAERPELPVIYTSGYAAEQAVHGEPLVEGVNFLAKPYAPNKLAHLVRERLDDARR